MGFLEAICVVYLRQISHIDRERLRRVSHGVDVEALREICTMLMILTVALVSGDSGRSRCGSVGFIFGIWDIAYYFGLRVLIKWPADLFNWDCLFLIPVRWYSPVLAPILISGYLVLAGCIWCLTGSAHARQDKSVLEFIPQAVAAILWYRSFTEHSIQIEARGFEGVRYSWTMFGLGACIAFGGLAVTLNQTLKLRLSSEAPALRH